MLAILLGMAACDTFPVSPRPEMRPAQPDAPKPEPSAYSRELASYYRSIEAEFRRNDLLRTDSGGPDAPFNARQLAENFEAIALNTEYSEVGGELVPLATPSPVSRWDVPVVISMTFGETVPEDLRAVDRETLAELVPRLARATGHSVTIGAPEDANFHVLVLDEDERRAFAPRIPELIPGVSQSALRSVVNLPRSTYCIVLASDPADDKSYRNAVAIIRSEHPPLMRKACLHEEIAQGLGLANDSLRARPSIFNDDEEYALLTYHDELLLKILYDDRLTTGMSPETARPIVAEIASELMGGDS